MNLLRSLHEFLAPYAQPGLRDEALCSCGDANHVRILTFRAAGRPVVLIVPEIASPAVDEVRDALRDPTAEPLAGAEYDTICAESDLGRPVPFSNPFGTSVYVDESLVLYPTLVFCPRMFGGREGECFRVPTRALLEGTQAAVLPLVPAPCPADEWAV